MWRSLDRIWEEERSVWEGSETVCGTPTSRTFRHCACPSEKTTGDIFFEIVEKCGAEVNKWMAISGSLDKITPFHQLLDDLILEQDDDLSTWKEQKDAKKSLHEALVRDGGDITDKGLGSMFVEYIRSVKSTRKIQQFDRNSSVRDTKDWEQSNGEIKYVDCTEVTPRVRKYRYKMLDDLNDVMKDIINHQKQKHLKHFCLRSVGWSGNSHINAKRKVDLKRSSCRITVGWSSTKCVHGKSIRNRPNYYIKRKVIGRLREKSGFLPNKSA